MKRTFAQVIAQAQEEEQNPNQQQLNGSMYGPQQKRLKLDTQRVGDCIVKALDAFHFKIVDSIEGVTPDEGQFFAPKYLYWLGFGEEEKIRGYSDLQVHIYLSSKRLIPYVQISFSHQVEQTMFTTNQTHDVRKMLEKHYGTLLTKDEFALKLAEEKDSCYKLPGDKIHELSNGRKVQQVRLSDDKFTNMNFTTQALLPFFIESATPIEPCPFWRYFLVYTPDDQLVCLFTVYEAHQTAVKFRLKISQVLVLPPYQRQGLASQMYQFIYEHYLKQQPNCFEIIVEDAADDFQKVQDIVNTKILKQTLEYTFKRKLQSQTIADVKNGQLTIQQAQKIAKQLKMPVNNIFRLNDMLLFAYMPQEDQSVVREFRLQLKRRLYIRCMRSYAELFVGKQEELGMKGCGDACLNKPYLYNDLLEEDQFAIKEHQDENIQIEGLPQMPGGVDPMKQITAEGVKMQLADMYKAIVASYNEIKNKICQN